MSLQLPRLARLLVQAAQENLPSVRLVGGAGLSVLLGHRVSADVDLLFLEQRGWPLLDGLDDALQKDAGLDLAWLAWAMRQIPIRPLPGLREPVDLEELRQFRDGMVDALLDRAGSLLGR